MRRTRLDDIDRAILRALTMDARISNQRLADLVGLTTTPCWNRVKALEENGVISQYVAVLNQEALGYPDTVIIEITLDRHDEKMLDRVGATLAQIPEVIELHMVTGDYDFLVKVAVAGTAGYEEFLRRRLYKIPNIRSSRSTFVLRSLKKEHSIAP